MTTVTTIDVRRHLGDFLNRVSIRHDEYVIERKGKPLAAMVPVSKFNAMRRAARAHLLDVLDGDSLMSDKEAMGLANEAKHASREG
ncbi:MAG TPA: type II toxin-antitoxin system Phd/YefM family antitoxin [Tichowtungia sp.]|nr:type II toxin-antitoxin system Phd/YefM family antitoxin [Tichowtungia sp.]